MSAPASLGTLGEWPHGSGPASLPPASHTSLARAVQLSSSWRLLSRALMLSCSSGSIWQRQTSMPESPVSRRCWKWLWSNSGSEVAESRLPGSKRAVLRGGDWAGLSSDIGHTSFTDSRICPVVTSNGSEKGRNGRGEERGGGEVRERGEEGWFVLNPTVTPGGCKIMVQLALATLLRLACCVSLTLASILLLLDLLTLTELLLFPGLLALPR